MDEAGSKARLDERSDLRKELQFLKECQFKYFSLAVTITGLIVGVADKFRQSAQDDRGVLLAPLLVVLPCWYIFFDKATTITRMVGYLTLLERMIARDDRYRFIGWENAVFTYRKEAADLGFRARTRNYWSGAFAGLKVLMSLRSANRYWVLCWTTFCGLTTASLWLGFQTTFSQLHWFLIAICSLVAMLTGLLLLQLLGGQYSYASAVAKWEEYLKFPAASNDGA